MNDVTKFIAQEKKQEGNIGFKTFSRYLKSMQWAQLFLPLIFFLLIISSISESLFRYFVSLWVDNCSHNNCSNLFYFENKLKTWLQQAEFNNITLFFFSFCVLAIFFKALNWIVFIGFLSNGARVLHDQMVESFSNVRVTFMDENPTGRLLRRFSGDYIQVKDEIPNVFVDIMSSLAELIIITLIVLIKIPIAIISVFPCVYFYYKVQNIFKASSREVQRLSKVLETPIWSLFNETVVGYQTIRAFGKTNEFINQLNLISQDYAKASLLQSRMLRWLNLRLKFISEFFSLTVTIISIFLLYKGKIGVGQAGFLMSLTIGLDAMMQWLTRSLSIIESKMVSVERIIEYKSLPSEQSETYFNSSNLPLNWPSVGNINIKNLIVSYREDLPIIIRNLTVNFEAGKKIGIIGRTGAGKSTIFQAFYRMLYFHSGQIIIDDIDILKIDLDVARSVFAIVPQEPHLFSGTLKYNLDRTGKYSEEQIWKALEEVQLFNYIDSLPGKLNYHITERGLNFSVGQRQLLCMVRAILSEAKIILMDEATASVDSETEILIQTAVKKVFANKTMIIIAHRLDTIKSADYIALLGNGELLDYGTPEVILSKLGENLQPHLI